MSRMLRVGSLVLLLAAPATWSACMHASAKTAGDSPPLDMPAPPPRVVETVEGAPVPPAPLAEEPPRQEVRPPVRRPARPEPKGEPRVDAQKPEVKPDSSAEAPKTGDEPTKPPATLQTTPAVAEGELERSIRVALVRAASELGRVDYRSLPRDGRTQYDTAKRFIEQAEEAMEPRTRNLLFARSLADKAVALAEQLAGR